jgi:pimeloyl-ACP methyl ester carboxylesterase
MAQSSISGAGMHVNVAGTGQPAVVFVHGFACDSTDWTAQLDSLAARMTVVSCDLGSHGLSPGQEQDASIGAYGSAVARLLDELGLSAVLLVGHSMGCRVVLECARAASERVVGIVLLDGSRIGVGDPTAAAQAMAARLEGAGYESFVREFFAAMFVPSSEPRLQSEILERALRLPPNVGRRLLVDIVRWDAGEMDGALSRVSVPLLTIQTTTLNASRERVSLAAESESAWLDLVRRHQPGVEIATLVGAGHFPHVENAEEVAELLGDFLGRVSATSSRSG